MNIDEVRYDLTEFMWELEMPMPDRVRLILHCAPCYDRILKARLHEAGLRARRVAKGRILIDRHESIYMFLMGVTDDDTHPDLRKAVNRYENAWEGRRGRPVGPEKAQERRAAALALFKAAPLCPDKAAQVGVE